MGKRKRKNKGRALEKETKGHRKREEEKISLGIIVFEAESKRKPFTIKTKKIEWALAAGRNAFDSSGKVSFVITSQCRSCKRPLTWGDRTYDFDHKDNNPSHNSQTNCYLVCKVCHGKHTVIKKRKVSGLFGGYQTIKKKVGYKKPKKQRNKKRVAVRDIFGSITGYRTVRTTRKRKATKKINSRRKKRKTKTSRNQNLFYL
jgi:hypothetical protein